MQFFASQNPYTPDEQFDLSPFKRFIALNESSALTSPGWDIPMQKSARAMTRADTSWNDFAKIMVQHSSTRTQLPHQCILPAMSRKEHDLTPCIGNIPLLVCICPGLLLLPCGMQPCLSLHHR